MNNYQSKYKGKMFELYTEDIQMGSDIIQFEKVRRTPGVRVIIDDVQNKKILLNKEYRSEHGDYDYRLPGGKVFDTLEEFINCDRGLIVEKAKLASIKEVKEECGIELKNPKLIHTSKCGASIEWDLYYFYTSNFNRIENGQSLEKGEIIDPIWVGYDALKDLILNSTVEEDRSIPVLIKFLLNK